MTATKRELAIAALRREFAEGKPRAATEMRDLVDQLGLFSYRWMQEQAPALGIRAVRVGLGAEGYWLWVPSGPLTPIDHPTLPSRINGSLPARKCQCPDYEQILETDEDGACRCFKCGSFVLGSIE